MSEVSTRPRRVGRPRTGLRPRRTIMRIELTDRAGESMRKLSEQLGMTQVSMMSRMVDSFEKLDRDVQQLLLARQYRPEVQKAIVKKVLASL